jgi:hypothetical protein
MKLSGNSSALAATDARLALHQATYFCVHAIALGRKLPIIIFMGLFQA